MDQRIAMLEAKMDRIQSRIDIEQLIVRYALAMDARDIDGLVALYSVNVRVGAPVNGVGHKALHEWFCIHTSDSYRSVHSIGGQVIDFDDSDHAHGSILSYAEHEIGDVWEITAYRSRDKYIREDCHWRFLTRRGQPYYRRNVGLPSIELAAPRPETPVVRLPQEFPTFVKFWKQFPPELVRRLTNKPLE
jgi:hypothetical protein